MKITLISPNLSAVRHDYLSTGIVYMPIGLVSVATYLKKNHHVHIIDSFGEAPTHIHKKDNFIFFGLLPEETVAKIPSDSDIIFVYADRLISYLSLKALIKCIKNQYTRIPLVVFENTQAVTAYSLQNLEQEFLKLGADFVIIGEPEYRAEALINNLAQKTLQQEEKDFSLDQLPFPDWSLIPIQNYWKLRYAHGPFETKSYLPLQTSRGCPYSCRFCVMPATNHRKWNPRSARLVVDEMEYNYNKFDVREYHVEDANPTVSDKRIREICHQIIQRQLPVIWKLVSGTKIETIKNEETLHLMKKAGCNYISIAPESGSPKLLKLMDKTFDFRHAEKMVRVMNQIGIRSQACFLAGFPGETKEDQSLTSQVAKKLVRAGLDELVISVVTPVPGSEIFNQFDGYSSYSDLNFSPSWRLDYPELTQYRKKLYRQFLLRKAFFFPLKIINHAFNLITKRFDTKMEMTLYRALKIKLLLRKVK